MTPDIVKLRDALPTLEPIIDRLELQLVDDPAWDEPSDTSYLSASERENPDIAANVEAMAQTNQLIAWFGRDAEGYLGLWRGPQNRSLNEAPVVRLDSEGQYSIVAASVPEYLAISVPEDEFAQTRDALTKVGFQVGFNPDAIWGALDGFDDDPNAYRNELYERARVARGLPRSDEEDETSIGEDVTSIGAHDSDADEEITASREVIDDDQGNGGEAQAVADEGDEEIDEDLSAVPQPRDFAAGSRAIPVRSSSDDVEFDFDDDDDDADSEDEGADDDDAPAVTTPTLTTAKNPATKAKAAAKPTAKAKPATKAKAAAKPATKAKKPATKAKAAAKPAAKAGAKKAAKPAAKKSAAKSAKPAGKKPAAKPASKASKKTAAKKKR